MVVERLPFAQNTLPPANTFWCCTKRLWGDSAYIPLGRKLPWGDFSVWDPTPARRPAPRRQAVAFASLSAGQGEAENAEFRLFGFHWKSGRKKPVFSLEDKRH